MSAGDPTPIGEKFGRNLFLSRRRAYLSQERLGARAGLHRTEIGLLENGQRVPRLDTLVKLIGALSVEPGELLAGIAWEVDGRRQPSGRFVLGPPGWPQDISNLSTEQRGG
jgi:transcriptional regulator with XRE-family HTH domain